MYKNVQIGTKTQLGGFNDDPLVAIALVLMNNTERLPKLGRIVAKIAITVFGAPMSKFLELLIHEGLAAMNLKLFSLM